MPRVSVLGRGARRVRQAANLACFQWQPPLRTEGAHAVRPYDVVCVHGIPTLSGTVRAKAVQVARFYRRW
jgi:hypothetical protein